jgi:glycosyltransferase involved in cell wall biosynthesis
MNEPLKVLYVIRTLTHGGGAERLMFDIYNELIKRTDVLFKIVVLQKSDFFKNYNIANADYYEKRMNNIIYLDYSFQLRLFKKNLINIEDYKKLVIDFQPDIIHSNLYLAELVSREYVWKNASYFSHVHDNIIQLQKFSLKTLVNKTLFTNFYEKIRIVKKYKQTKTNFICISNETTNFIKDNLSEKLNKRTFLLPNAIDLSRFSLSAKKIKSKEKFQLISIGSLALRKNHIFLIDVVHFLIKNGISIHLTILGEGIERKKIEQKIDELKLKKHITLTGNVSDIVSYLNDADLYVHSATSEPFGLVLLEAMASGLPVIALDGKGNRDFIIDDHNGYLINEFSVSKMGNKIIEILHNEDTFHRISKNAIETSKKYAMSEYVDKLISIYKNSK